MPTQHSVHTLQGWVVQQHILCLLLLWLSYSWYWLVCFIKVFQLFYDPKSYRWGVQDQLQLLKCFVILSSPNNMIRLVLLCKVRHWKWRCEKSLAALKAARGSFILVDNQERQGVTNFSPRCRMWRKHPTSLMVENTTFSVRNTTPLHAAQYVMHDSLEKIILY